MSTAHMRVYPGVRILSLTAERDGVVVILDFSRFSPLQVSLLTFGLAHM